MFGLVLTMLVSPSLPSIGTVYGSLSSLSSSLSTELDMTKEQQVPFFISANASSSSSTVTAIQPQQQPSLLVPPPSASTPSPVPSPLHSIRPTPAIKCESGTSLLQPITSQQKASCYIEIKYQELRSKGFSGGPVSRAAQLISKIDAAPVEFGGRVITDGYYQDFRDTQGKIWSIYWSPRTGAHEMRGEIVKKWNDVNKEHAKLGTPLLGLPTIDETITPDGIGRYNHLEFGGSIYYTPQTGAHEVSGKIREVWAGRGWEKSCLGYPISDTNTIPDVGGLFSQFQYGYISNQNLIGVQVVCKGSELPRPAVIPAQHSSHEANRDLPPGNNNKYPFCYIDVGAGLVKSFIAMIFGKSTNLDVGTIIPTWTPVKDPANPAILEGVVVMEDADAGANVAYEDLPIAHYTHDFIFHVKPDITIDKKYTNLLGMQSKRNQPAINPQQEVDLINKINILKAEIALLQKNPKANSGAIFVKRQQIDQLQFELDFNVPRKEVRQQTIEVEWEMGIGQNNDETVPPNRYGSAMRDIAWVNQGGDSAGFFSAGHKPREIFWNWPTIGDHVHVEGNWVWDRGHPPPKTEIHPPRLVAVQRHLLHPLALYGPDTPGPKSPTFTTRIDVYASGDGGGLWNNRGQYPWVQKVPMKDRDHSFIMMNVIPKPSPTAELKWIIQKRPGDTFPGEPIIEKVSPNGPDVRITIPWKSRNVPDNTVFGRTIFLYWSDKGQPAPLPPNYKVDVFEVTLNSLVIRKTQDVFNGDYRLFAEVGGNWFFVNELYKPVAENGDILNHALGETTNPRPQNPLMSRLFNLQDNYIRLNNNPLVFRIYVPPGENFRVHASGWEADGSNLYFGRLVNPYHPCDGALKAWLNDNFFTFEVARNGGGDDPIGYINSFYGGGYGLGLGNHEDKSGWHRPPFSDVFGDENPADSYRLAYTIRKVS